MVQGYGNGLRLGLAFRLDMYGAPVLKILQICPNIVRHAIYINTVKVRPAKIARWHVDASYTRVRAATRPFVKVAA